MVSKCMKKAQLIRVSQLTGLSGLRFYFFSHEIFHYFIFLHHQNLTKMQFGFRDTCAYCNSYMSHKLLIDNGILRSV